MLSRSRRPKTNIVGWVVYRPLRFMILRLILVVVSVSLEFMDVVMLIVACSLWPTSLRLSFVKNLVFVFVQVVVSCIIALGAIRRGPASCVTGYLCVCDLVARLELGPRGCGPLMILRQGILLALPLHVQDSLRLILPVLVHLCIVPVPFLFYRTGLEMNLARTLLIELIRAYSILLSLRLSVVVVARNDAVDEVSMIWRLCPPRVLTRTCVLGNITCVTWWRNSWLFTVLILVIARFVRVLILMSTSWETLVFWVLRPIALRMACSNLCVLQLWWCKCLWKHVIVENLLTRALLKLKNVVTRLFLGECLTLLTRLLTLGMSILLRICWIYPGDGSC